jgi:hypothetical protein
MSDLANTPLGDIVATYLYENWQEDFADLDDVVQAFAAEATGNQIAALRADIEEAVITYGDAPAWPAALWPFDEGEVPPVEFLTEIARRLG